MIYANLYKAVPENVYYLGIQFTSYENAIECSSSANKDSKHMGVIIFEDSEDYIKFPHLVPLGK